MIPISHSRNVFTSTINVNERSGEITISMDDDGSVPGYGRHDRLSLNLSKAEAAQIAAALTEYAESP